MAIDFEYSVAAEQRLAQIVDELWTFAPSAAESFAAAHDKAIEQLLRFPESG